MNCNRRWQKSYGPNAIVPDHRSSIQNKSRPKCPIYLFSLSNGLKKLAAVMSSLKVEHIYNYPRSETMLLYKNLYNRMNELLYRELRDDVAAKI